LTRYRRLRQKILLLLAINRSMQQQLTQSLQALLTLYLYQIREVIPTLQGEYTTNPISQGLTP
jgi:hypothetical protein